MVRAGARKSAPDLAIDVPWDGLHGIRIEMKKHRKHFAGPAAIRNAVQPGQEEFIHSLRQLGYAAKICYGWVEAAEFVCEYFDWNPEAKGVAT